jgi:hypothetical protein
MSGASAAFPARMRIGDLCGHYASDAICVCIVVATAVGLWPLTGVLMTLVPLTVLVTVVLAWLAMRSHDRRLCEHCVRALPLDAGRRAERYHRRFATVHLATHKPFLFGYLAVLIGVNLVPGTPGRVLWVAAQLSMIYLIQSHVAHRRFQPWCPRCRGGGGSDREDVPEPLPDDRRQLV